MGPAFDHQGNGSIALAPLLDSDATQKLSTDAELPSPAVVATRCSPRTPGGDLQGTDAHLVLESFDSDNGTPLGNPLTLPQQAAIDSIARLDDVYQSDFTAADNSWEQEAPPQDFVTNSWNTPGPVHSPAFGVPMSSAWSPQQTLTNGAGDQGYMGFTDPSMLPAQMMAPQTMVPAQTFLLSPSFLGPSLYPPFSVLQRTPCHLCPQTFARHSDLARHYASVHLGIKHHCFYPGCANNRGNGYCRLEKLRTHQREKHGVAWS